MLPKISVLIEVFGFHSWYVYHKIYIIEMMEKMMDHYQFRMEWDNLLMLWSLLPQNFVLSLSLMNPTFMKMYLSAAHENIDLVLNMILGYRHLYTPLPSHVAILQSLAMHLNEVNWQNNFHIRLILPGLCYLKLHCNNFSVSNMDGKIPMIYVTFYFKW